MPRLEMPQMPQWLQNRFLDGIDTEESQITQEELTELTQAINETPIPAPQTINMASPPPPQTFQDVLNEEVTEQVRDSLMGNTPTTDIEYQRMRNEMEANMHRMNAQTTTRVEAGSPVYLEPYIPDGMSQGEYAARVRAGETFERVMTIREREIQTRLRNMSEHTTTDADIWDRSAELRTRREHEREMRRARGRRDLTQGKEEKMAQKDVTVMNIMEMYKTDMREKYHVASLSTRHPLNVFRDAITIKNRITSNRGGDSTESKMFLSPNIGSLTLASTNVMPFKHFTELVGLNMDRIYRNVRRIREQELEIVFIGYGGMSINMLHFMEMLKATSTNNRLFKSLTIYEPDQLSLTNMFRIYKDCSKINGSIEESQYKTNLFKERKLSDTINIVNKYFTEEDAKNWAGRTIFIGAPDFGTRELLKNRRFFFVGHGDNEISITYQPSTEHDMTIETYGKIDVRILWSNLLSATEAILEILPNTNFDSLKPNTEMFVNNAYEIKSSNRQRATSSDQHSF